MMRAICGVRLTDRQNTKEIMQMLSANVLLSRFSPLEPLRFSEAGHHVQALGLLLLQKLSWLGSPVSKKRLYIVQHLLKGVTPLEPLTPFRVLDPIKAHNPSRALDPRISKNNLYSKLSKTIFQCSDSKLF